MNLLSKSTFVRGIQCEKSLWYNKHRKELRNELTESQEAIFARGHRVGELAQKLFLHGELVVPENAFPSFEYVQKTQELIKQGVSVLYEACFMSDDVMCAMDIMVKKNNKWYAYEVKSSTKVSETYILDASLQSYIICNSGIDLADLSIVYLDNTYVRNGELEIEKLFAIESIFEQSKDLRQVIPSKIKYFKEILLQKNEPDISIGEHCFNPYMCDFYGHCWQHIPHPAVFDLSRMKISKKFELYEQGVVSFEDIPTNVSLTEAQHIQIEAYKSNEVIIDKHNVKEFVKSLNYPLYHLDFETIMPAIPLFDNSRPYQQICFQYSIHREDSQICVPNHFEFLANAVGDPRKAFIEKLIHDVGVKGDILVYNQGFESARLREIALDFPQYSHSIELILERIVDLMIPFQKKWVYHPAMNGSYSIKKVLPALIPNLSYKGMKIADGGTAMNAFESLYYEKDFHTIEVTRKALLEYCGMDTWAMVKILEYLKQI